MSTYLLGVQAYISLLSLGSNGLPFSIIWSQGASICFKAILEGMRTRFPTGWRWRDSPRSLLPNFPGSRPIECELPG